MVQSGLDLSIARLLRSSTLDGFAFAGRDGGLAFGVRTLPRLCGGIALSLRALGGRVIGGRLEGMGRGQRGGRLRGGRLRSVVGHVAVGGSVPPLDLGRGLGFEFGVEITLSSDAQRVHRCALRVDLRGDLGRLFFRLRATEPATGVLRGVHG